jgi:hypothetical protein
MLADTPIEIADRARVFAVLQGVPVSQRRAAAKSPCLPDSGDGLYRGWTGGIAKI